MIGRLIVGSMVMLSFATNQMVSTVHAERSSKQAWELLSYLWSAREVEAKCHALTDTQRSALDESIAELLQLMNVSEAKITETFKGSNVAAHLKCDDDLAKALINMAKASSGTEPESEQATGEEGKMSWGYVQESWSNIFRDLPGGKLAMLEGCWNGQVETEPISVCFEERGNTIKVHFGRKSRAICSFEGGGARQRDRSIIFFSQAIPENVQTELSFSI